jgi:hypothetical protein
MGLGAMGIRLLEMASFVLMVAALLVGAVIILGAMIRGHRDHRLSLRVPEPIAE